LHQRDTDALRFLGLDLQPIVVLNQAWKAALSDTKEGTT